MSLYAGFLLVLSLACFPACSKKEPILLGFVGGLSGRVADLGIGGRNGTILAVEQRNAAGGVRGRRIELLVVDDEQDPETAKRAVRELIDGGVGAIIGHMTSAMSTATIPLVNQRRVVMMSPTTTTDYLSGKDDYFFRVTATTKDYGRKMARYIRSHLGIDSVALVCDLRNQAYTESWATNFRAEFESLGGTVRAKETFYSGPDVHMLDVVRRVARSEPGVFVFVAGALDTAMLSQQVRKLGIATPIVAAEWAATEELLNLGGVAVEGAIVSQFFDRFSTAPTFQAFRTAYRDRFGQEPGFGAVNAFDAAKAVMDAMEAQGPGEELRKTILRIRTFPGVQNAVVLDEFGDAGRGTFIATIRNGKFVPMK